MAPPRCHLIPPRARSERQAAKVAEERRRAELESKAERPRGLPPALVFGDGTGLEDVLRSAAPPLTPSPRLVNRMRAAAGWLTEDELQKTAHAARDILYEERYTGVVPQEEREARLTAAAVEELKAVVDEARRAAVRLHCVPACCAGRPGRASRLAAELTSLPPIRPAYCPGRRRPHRRGRRR